MPIQPRPNQSLSGKSAVVTGGGGAKGGIGRAISCHLAAAGANVAVIDRDYDQAADVVEQIRNDGGSALAILGDVSSVEECGSAVHDAIEAFGGVHILVNNVGISRSARAMQDVNFDTWSEVFATNVRSALAMAHFCLPAMKAQGGGSIVNIASIAGIQAFGGDAYGPSKAALIALTRELALMHGRDGIRANVVLPGHVYTPHVGAMMTDELRAARRLVSPLGIEGDAWDIAQATLFLASDAARFVTGVALPVDGGVTTIGAMAGHALIERG